MSRLKKILLLASLIFVASCAQSNNQADNFETPTIQNTSVSSTGLTQPNIVFILVDDLGFGDVGFNGSEIATPNLDKMANAGIKLNRNYVYPICSPTRAALLTGQNPLHHGIDGPLSDTSSLPTDLRIMPEYFKDLGYQTFMVGKWHLGIGKTSYWPNERGFDYHYGHLGGWVDFYTRVYQGGLDWVRNGEVVEEEGHATDLLSNDAQRVIENRDKSKPFLLYLAYNAPHSPLQYTPSNSGLNDAIESGDRAVYAEMTTQADAGMGQVIATLESQGILDNTIVVFSSDNGGSLGLGASNGELRGGKGNTFEGGMRVPGLIWWPSKLASGQTFEQQIAVHDWLPTLLEAVGGDKNLIANAYGQSMWAGLANGKQIERKPIIIGARASRAVYEWPWKLIQVDKTKEDSIDNFMLFDVVNDPNETNNVANEHAEMVQRLSPMITQTMPVVESRQASGPPPGGYFRIENSQDWNYQLRLQATHEPWAELATP